MIPLHAPTPRHGALIILFVLLSLSPVLFWAGSLEAFESIKALALLGGATLLGWMGLAAFPAPGEKGWPCDGLTLAVLAGAGVASLATLTSIAPLHSLLGNLDSQGGLVGILALTVVYLAARQVIQSETQVAGLFSAVVVGTALAVGYGMTQALHIDPLLWDGRSGFAGWFRPGGTEGHAIKLGALLVIVLPLLFWLGGRGARTITGLLVIVFLGVLLTLLARGAWLGACAAALVAFCFAGRASWLTWPRLGLGVLTILVVLGLLGMLGPLLQRLAGFGESTSRLYIFQSAWGLFLDRPLLGWGPDTFHLVFCRHREAEYWALEWGRTPFRAHNEWLHVLATQGVLGGLAYLALLVALVRAGWLAWQRAPQQRGLVVALLAASVGHQVQLLTGFSTVTSSLLFAVVCGLLGRLSEGPLETSTSVPLGRPLLWVVAALGSAVLLTNVLCFDQRSFTILHLGSILLAVLPAWLAAWAYQPEDQSPERPPSWPDWLRPVPLLGLVVAVVVIWCLVVRPGAAWVLCQSAPEEAVSWCPEREELWANLSRKAREASGRASERERQALQKRAVEAARCWCKLSPLSTEAHSQLGLALLELARAGAADLGEVLEVYDAALKLDERNVVLLRDAARAALALGAFARAEPYLERAIQVGPAHGSIRTEQATVALVRRDLVLAQSLIEQAFKEPWHDDVEGYHRAYGLAALIALERNDHTQALHLARLMKPQRPDWAVFSVIEGTALEKLGRFEEAHTAYRRALEVEPGHAVALAGVRRMDARAERSARLVP